MSITRRTALGSILAVPVSGVVFGYSVHRGNGPDLTFVAEEWLRDARSLGMLVMLQPDGRIWRIVPIHDGSERARARDAHWMKLENRPRLMRAVHAKAKSGFVPEPPPCA